MDGKPIWFEFFAGGGMARIGLGAEWHCVFANDISEKKAAAYRAFFGAAPELRVCDVASLRPDDLPGIPGLVWASFPCQDLSLAGSGAGLRGARSGTFKPFWKLVRGSMEGGRTPRLIVLENVTGALTSHQGRDFATIIGSLAKAGYRVGCLILDAVHFLPQSRPRLFVVAAHCDLPIPPALTLASPAGPWHTPLLRSAHSRLPAQLQRNWIWWNLPAPTQPVPPLTDLIEEEPGGVVWHTREQTERLIGLMAPLHREKLENAKRLNRRIVGTVYKRTRSSGNGLSKQRAEIRFDQISGCLRTPAGGSSRQLILVVEGRHVRSRLLSAREAARLMGVPDCYPLPAKYNEAYHIFGDGVVVPAVNWLGTHLLLPLAHAGTGEKAA
jgi:DNA (cytosine-5)-methyltransferase 1